MPDEEPTSERRRWAPIAALVVLGAVAGVLAAVSLTHGGIGWDAPIDAQAALDVRNLPVGLTLQDAYDRIYATSEFYGVLVSQLADLLRSLIDAQATPGSPTELLTYRWQAAVSVTLAVVAAGALGWAARSVTKSSLAGAFAWALTLSTPVYVGMSYVDFKDIPLAAGLTLLTSGLILSRTEPTPARRWSLGMSCVVLGSTLALAVRPAAWTLVGAVVGGSLLAYAAADLYRRRPRRLLPTAAAALAGGVASIAFLLITNPLARIDLPRWLVDAYVVMRAFPWPGYVRMAGQDVWAPDTPWWYLPAWFLAQLPLVTTLALIGTAICLAAALAGRPWALSRGTLVSATPWLIQGVVLPLTIVAADGVLYDGLRHVLFAVPALVGLAALAVATVERSTRRRQGFVALSAAGAALVIVLASLWATVRWYPYSYAFINPIASSAFGERGWELDYWGVTAVEGVEWLRESGFDIVAVKPNPATSSMVGGRTPEEAASSGADFGLYVFYRWDTTLDDCTSLFTIERDGQVLGEGARCPE